MAFLGLKSTAQQLENAVGRANFERFLRTPDIGLSPEAVREEIRSWLKLLISALERRDESVPESTVLHEATQQYWWDDESLDWPFDELIKISTAATSYNNLPKGLGSASHRERHLRSTGALLLARQVTRFLEAVAP